MDKLAHLLDFLQKYAASYRIIHSLAQTATVMVEMVSSNGAMIFYCLPVTVGTEPVGIPVGAYWSDDSSIRKCVSTVPTGHYLHTYQDIIDYTEFGIYMVLASEDINVSPSAPPPAPLVYSSKGTIEVSDGKDFKDFPPGHNGYALVAESAEPLGLQWQPILTPNSVSTMTSKTLVSPVINGVVTGNFVLNEENLVSDSATQVPTQHSVKAYVDNKIASFAVFSSINVAIVMRSDGIHCSTGNPVYCYNAGTLVSTQSAAIATGQSVLVGTTSFELETSGMAVGVVLGTLIPANVVSVDLINNSCNELLVEKVNLVGNQLQISFTDMNGVFYCLNNMPVNSCLEILIMFK